jgi:hypothetical protein
MNRTFSIFSALFFALFAGVANGAVGIADSVDCGPAYVRESVKSIEGIATVQCKKLWCRDLENGRLMGKDNSPNSGYKVGQSYSFVYDNEERIDCFGERKWCDNYPKNTKNEEGKWNPGLGIYTKGLSGGALWRGVLGPDCYYWQEQKHRCDSSKGEVAIHNGTSWSCVVQAESSGAFGKAAMKARAVRRTSGVVNIKLKPKAKVIETSKPMGKPKR